MMLCLFIIPPWLGAGASMAITTIIFTLFMVRAKLGKLPAKLYVQGDNGSENKNRAVLFFLCWMIDLHIFQTIEFYMLIPGHTHEDIDAWFSVISRWLIKVYIFTMSELMNRWSEPCESTHR